MRIVHTLALAVLLGALASPFSGRFESEASEGVDHIVTSIKPVHALVSGVLAGVAEPELLLDGASSPHTYSLKPSQARSLQQASLIFWIGEELELFLVKPLATLGREAGVVPLEDTPGVKRLPVREGGAFASPKTAENGISALQAQPGDNGSGNPVAYDPHIWLDPLNAELMVSYIAGRLTELYPDNAAQFAANAAATRDRLQQLTEQVNTLLAPVRDRPFVVFHDGFRYFEDRFGLNAIGSLTVNPDTMPGVARITEIKNKVKELEAACVFSEPQFQSRIVNVIREGTDAKAGVLDPLGSDLEEGPELYFQLILNMAESFRQCLVEKP
uniref:zinc ABC transporter substrate-binding protein n=1 Tax=Pararhizobium sp. IMCC3301 TaxID=3067904 RepID=UPI002741C122|nr:zinc ABC transporter substrate-binding protein [Pararhizobium sp. IMCC3301]